MTKKPQERWFKGVKIQNNFTGVHAPGPFLEAYEFDTRDENGQYLTYIRKRTQE